MRARAASIVLVLAASAAAQDGKPDGAKPDPGRPAAPAPATPLAPAKKERTCSPEAEAAITKYVALLHFPSSKYKTLVMNTHADVATMGGEVGAKLTVKDGDVAIDDVALPEALRQQGSSGQVAEMKKGAAAMIGRFFKPFLVPADVMAQQYSLSAKTENGKTVVEMTRFADAAAWERLTLHFDKDGLLESESGTPNVDPNDQMGAFLAGAEIETKFTYQKRGELYTVESGTITEPMGETTAKLTYFEIEGQAPLPNELQIESPMLGAVDIFLHDFVVNGKAVAGTVRKAEPKPEKPAAPPKKADPPKAGDAPKPGDTPPKK